MSRGIRAGRMKDRLSIQTATIVASEYGGQSETWTTTATRKCGITPLRAAEFYRASGDTVQNVYEIRFRYERGLLDEGKQLLDTRVSPNRVFDIEAIVNTGNWDNEIVITAVERKWPLRD